MILLGHHYFHGKGGIQRDQAKAIELYAKAVDLGHGKAHFHLADVYYEGGDMKKAKFHWEAAAMAGHDNARINLGILEVKSGNCWTIAASSGHYNATFQLKTCFEEGFVSRESINSTLTAYNNSCAEMRSKAMSLCHPYTY
jgi:TPR repeat protein